MRTSNSLLFLSVCFFSECISFYGNDNNSMHKRNICLCRWSRTHFICFWQFFKFLHTYVKRFPVMAQIIQALTLHKQICVSDVLVKQRITLFFAHSRWRARTPFSITKRLIPGRGFVTFLFFRTRFAESKRNLKQLRFLILLRQNMLLIFYDKSCIRDFNHKRW